MRNTSVDEIEEIWEDIKESAEEQRRELKSEFGDTYGVPEKLERPLRQRRTGEKVNRTLPVARAYETYTGKKLPENVLRPLVGRDILIDAWDDFIDTPRLSKDERIGLTIMADFADQLRFSAVTDQHQDAIQEAEIHYKTLLFNIPYQEHAQKSRLESAQSQAERRQAAVDFYQHRSRVIDGFTYYPALWFDIDEAAASTIKDDLRTNTARRQLFKDIRDAPQDIEDNDEKPPVIFMRQYSSPESIADHIRFIRDSFEYSQQSEAAGYRSELRELEGEPEVLEAEISAQMAEAELMPVYG